MKFGSWQKWIKNSCFSVKIQTSFCGFYVTMSLKNVKNCHFMAKTAMAQSLT
jgi:hypothetical protein